MKFTYLTVITTDEYLEGVLVLNESLVNTKSKFPLLVLATKNVSSKTKNIIESQGINLINIPDNINLPKGFVEKNLKKGYSHWSNTLDKLYIFELIQFEKIVYLDSDMIVLKNLDELFNYPHMSAVVAGKSYPGNEGWVKLNSGLMVIKPQKDLSKDLIKEIPTVLTKKEYFGDQDILHEYYREWEYQKEKELDENYNVFFNYIEYYINELGYRLNGDKSLKVIHFIGKDKPWMRRNSFLFKQYLYYILNKNYYSAKILRIYCSILMKVRYKIQ